jgi:hypothetical protein
MADLTHTAFLGDAERTFLLTPDLIIELERKIGLGIGALFQLMIKGDFSHAHIVELVRFALIGGGSSPAEADALTKAWVLNRPYGETYPLAVSILEALWFGGKAKEPVADE